MNNKNIPVLPLRDIVVFPHMVAPLFVGRKLSITAKSFWFTKMECASSKWNLGINKFINVNIKIINNIFLFNENISVNFLDLDEKIIKDKKTKRKKSNNCTSGNFIFINIIIDNKILIAINIYYIV